MPGLAGWWAGGWMFGGIFNGVECGPIGYKDGLTFTLCRDDGWGYGIGPGEDCIGA